ncbi:membrane protein insertion efficiency factor YidD [Bacteroidota bacterium]
MKLFLVTILFSAGLLSAQTDWVKWEAVETSYEMPVPAKRNFQIDLSNFGTMILTGMVKFYHTAVSDMDGDNCPFYPSCSEFFVQSVKKTDIFLGTLMFVDRFTRDANFFKSRTQYPLHSSGKLYDPIVNYTLDFKNINYIPHDHIVK